MKSLVVRLPVAAALACAAAAVTWPIWDEIIRRARLDPENSHIVLALPVAVWLGWLRRARLRRVRPETSWVGLVMIAAGWGMIEAGYFYRYDIVQQLGALIAVVGAVTSVMGTELLMRLKPSLIALLFLFPVPGRIRTQIALPLQEISASITEGILQIFGVAIERSGNLLTLNGTDVAVAEACNGMRMVSALALITFAFVFSVPMRPSVRVALLIASPLIALLVNVVRLVPTTLMYGYASTDLADTFHDASGWIMLVIGLGVLWLILALLRWVEIPIDPYPVQQRATS